MGELSSALDALAADDLFALPAPALLDREAELLSARNRLDAELARTTRRAELAQAAEHDGQKTMASWLRGHGHLSPRAAGLLVRNGRALAHLPAVAAACVAGVITADQLAIIAPITTPANLAAAAAQDIDLAVIDQALVDVATGERYDRLAQVVHHYLSALDPDGPEPDPTENRCLHITRHADGSRSGRFDLDAVGGEKLDTALEAILQAGRCAGDIRTRPQQLADALVQLADLALAGGDAAHPAHRQAARRHHRQCRGPPWRRHRTRRGRQHLHDPFRQRASPLPGSGRPASACCCPPGRSATWPATACSPGSCSTPTGADPPRTHQTRRLAPAAPHRRAPRWAMRLRRLPGPAYWCDVHHVVHWLDGGETCPENSGLLCERHHTQVHHGFRIERDPDGRWHTYRPDGTEIIVYPKLRT